MSVDTLPHLHPLTHPKPSARMKTLLFTPQPAGEDRAGDLEGDGDLLRHVGHTARGAPAGLQVRRNIFWFARARSSGEVLSCLVTPAARHVAAVGARRSEDDLLKVEVNIRSGEERRLKRG